MQSLWSLNRLAIITQCKKSNWASCTGLLACFYVFLCIMFWSISYVIYILDNITCQCRPTLEKCLPIGSTVLYCCNNKVIHSHNSTFSDQLWPCGGQLRWYGPPWGAPERNLCLWFWETFCHSGQGHSALMYWTRCYRSGPVRYRQDCYLLHCCPSTAGHQPETMSSSSAGSN